MIRIIIPVALLALAACDEPQVTKVNPGPGEVDCTAPDAPASQCEPETR
ncbi:hypothetical protein ACSMXM_05360 [Pacificimonas sp. ICDLI1SI03]